MMARRALMFALCALLGVGCAECSIDAVGEPIDARCIFHDSLGQDIESDEGKLRADVSCEPNVDCGSDRRALLRGTKVEYKIAVHPAELDSEALRAGSTDDAILAVGLDRVEDDLCDDSKIMYGTAEFRGVGEAALVVYYGDEEVDRYTTTTYDADHLELISSQSAGAIDSLTVVEPIFLRLSVVSEEGVRLIGGYDFEWEVDDEAIAVIDEESTGKPKTLALLKPVAIGTSVLRVRSSGLVLEIPLEVTGVNRHDGGIPDSGVADDD